MTSWLSDPQNHVQVFIALFGVSAVALTQSRQEKMRRWASVLGLIGQPFWFWSSWYTEQYGIFVLSFLYTIVWARGFYTDWISKARGYTAEDHLQFVRECLSADVIWLAGDAVASKVIRRYIAITSIAWHTSDMRDAIAIRKGDNGGVLVSDLAPL